MVPEAHVQFVMHYSAI